MTYEQEEYLEQDEDERESAGRRKAVLALVILAVLVAGGLFLVDRLRDVSRLQDCLMSRATNCAPITPPASPPAGGASTSR